MPSQRIQTFVAFRYQIRCLNISGVYQCGPASVEAVKCGAVGFNYDVTFMLSTVNADLVRWKEDDTNEFNYSKIDSNKYQ
jgi:transglutaminase 1